MRYFQWSWRCEGRAGRGGSSLMRAAPMSTHPAIISFSRLGGLSLGFPSRRRAWRPFCSEGSAVRGLPTGHPAGCAGRRSAALGEARHSLLRTRSRSRGSRCRRGDRLRASPKRRLVGTRPRRASRTRPRSAMDRACVGSPRLRARNKDGAAARGVYCAVPGIGAPLSEPGLVWTGGRVCGLICWLLAPALRSKARGGRGRFG